MMSGEADCLTCLDIVQPIVNEKTLICATGKAFQRQFENGPVRFYQLFFSGNDNIGEYLEYRRRGPEFSPGFGAKIADCE